MSLLMSSNPYATTRCEESEDDESESGGGDSSGYMPSSFATVRKSSGKSNPADDDSGNDKDSNHKASIKSRASNVFQKGMGLMKSGTATPLLSRMSFVPSFGSKKDSTPPKQLLMMDLSAGSLMDESVIGNSNSSAGASGDVGGVRRMEDKSETTKEKSEHEEQKEDARQLALELQKRTTRQIQGTTRRRTRRKDSADDSNATGSGRRTKKQPVVRRIGSDPSILDKKPSIRRSGSDPSLDKKGSSHYSKRRASPNRSLSKRTEDESGGSYRSGQLKKASSHRKTLGRTGSDRSLGKMSSKRRISPHGSSTDAAGKAMSRSGSDPSSLSKTNRSRSPKRASSGRNLTRLSANGDEGRAQSPKRTSSGRNLPRVSSHGAQARAQSPKRTSSGRNLARLSGNVGDEDDRGNKKGRSATARATVRHSRSTGSALSSLKRRNSDEARKKLKGSTNAVFKTKQTSSGTCALPPLKKTYSAGNIDLTRSEAKDSNECLGRRGRQLKRTATEEASELLKYVSDMKASSNRVPRQAAITPVANGEETISDRTNLFIMKARSNMQQLETGINRQSTSMARLKADRSDNDVVSSLSHDNKEKPSGSNAEFPQKNICTNTKDTGNRLMLNTEDLLALVGSGPTSTKNVVRALSNQVSMAFNDDLQSRPNEPDPSAQDTLHVDTLTDSASAPLLVRQNLWQCMCGEVNRKKSRHCEKCLTAQNWTCVQCTFDRNLCCFRFCGGCAQPRSMLREDQESLKEFLDISRNGVSCQEAAA